MKTVVMYHSKCFDGTMAAAGALHAIHKGTLAKDTKMIYISYPQATFDKFFGGNGHYIKAYGAEKYIFVDFCPPEDVVVELVRRGHQVVILDHHKTAEANVGHLKDLEGVEIIFDSSRSGASISWQYFADWIPSLVKYVEDRDLWKWQLPQTKEVIAWLSATAETNNPESYLEACESFHHDEVTPMQVGAYLVKEMNCRVEEMASRFRYAEIEGFGRGAFVNAPVYQSEVCEYIYERYPVPFVIAYAVTKEGQVSVSARSKKGAAHAVDVAAMAENLFGGGGHHNAAGGAMDQEVLFDILQSSEPQEK